MGERKSFNATLFEGNTMTKSEKIYHISQKRCTALIIKIIKAGRYFLDGDIYQVISQLCCEILVGLVGAVAFFMWVRGGCAKSRKRYAPKGQHSIAQGRSALPLARARTPWVLNVHIE